MSKRVRLVAFFVLVVAAGAWLGAQEQPAATPTQDLAILPPHPEDGSRAIA